MATLFVDQTSTAVPNPMDMIESVIASNGWPYERLGEDEITAAVSGEWCEYQLRFFWREEGRILQTVCVFDARVPDGKRPAIYEALALINERLWMGHFEIWSDDGMIMFRHAVMVGEETSQGKLGIVETLLETAFTECEKFYPVFQFVIWAGKTAHEAIEAAMLETVGEA